MIIRKLLIAGLTASVLMTTGCGEEDEETSGFSWDISEGNAERVAAEVLSMKDFMTGFSEDNTASDPATGLKTSNQKLLDGTPQNCQVSGTMAITLSESTFAITMDNCDNGDGEGASTGTVSFSSASTGESEITTSFTFDLTSQGGSMDGSLVIVSDFGSGAYSFDMDMTLVSSEGSISIVTNPAFAGTGLMPPYEGQMVITDLSNNASLRVTAGVPSSEQVTIEVDEDGNGAYETTIETLWTNLD